MTHRLHVDAVTSRRDTRTVSRNLSLAIPEGSFSVIARPSTCGKSTLLAALSRLLAPAGGRAVLDGGDIHNLPGREMARRLGLLPQSALAPDSIMVAELVAHGHYPHQSFLRQWSPADERAVAAALRATRVDGLAERLLDTLSGGQRQRMWIAMVLAQEIPLLLLDEPTAYLDIIHQIELLELLTELDRQGRTIVAVLHDLDQACHYASHLVAIRDDATLAEGTPAHIFTERLVEEVFGLRSLIVADPVSGTSLLVPRGIAADAPG